MLTLQKQEFQEITGFLCSEHTQHHAKSFKHFSHMVINGKETERFVHFTEAVQWVMQKRNCTNQEATHFVWDNQFTMGTDRAIWITI